MADFRQGGGNPPSLFNSNAYQFLSSCFPSGTLVAITPVRNRIFDEHPAEVRQVFSAILKTGGGNEF